MDWSRAPRRGTGGAVEADPQLRVRGQRLQRATDSGPGHIDRRRAAPSTRHLGHPPASRRGSDATDRLSTLASLLYAWTRPAASGHGPTPSLLPYCARENSARVVACPARRPARPPTAQPGLAALPGQARGRSGAPCSRPPGRAPSPVGRSRLAEPLSTLVPRGSPPADRAGRPAEQGQHPPPERWTRRDERPRPAGPSGPTTSSPTDPQPERRLPRAGENPASRRSFEQPTVPNFERSPSDELQRSRPRVFRPRELAPTTARRAVLPETLSGLRLPRAAASTRRRG